MSSIDRMGLAAIGPDPHDPGRAHSTIHTCPICAARPHRLCCLTGSPAGADHNRYAVHADRPTVPLAHLDRARGVPTVAGLPAADVVAALDHRRAHGGYSCRVPACDADAGACFVAADVGKLAGRAWHPGDVIDLCAVHAGDVYAVAGAVDGRMPLWLHADYHDDPSPAAALAEFLAGGVDQADAEASPGADERPADLPEHLTRTGAGVWKAT